MELFILILRFCLKKQVKKYIGNPLMIAAVFIGFALQLMVTEQPALVAAFQTVRLNAGEWKTLLVLAAMPLFAHEMFIFLTHIFNPSKTAE